MEIIMINVGQNDSEAKASRFIRKNDIRYPVIFDANSKITMEYRITGVPTVIMADTTGTILFRQYYVPNQREITELLQ